MTKGRRSLMVLAGGIVMLVAFFGLLLFGSVLNPPTTPLMVALVDIPSGTVLTRDMLGIDDVRMNSQVTAALLTEDELGAFLGGVAVQPIHAFSPVSKASIVVEGNPAAANRLSLGLSNPNVVAMVIPVDRETSPQNIMPGDYVDLNFGVGSASFLAGTFSPAPTPLPFQPLPGVLITGVPEPTEGPTPTTEPPITLPVAKTIVHAARVLDVIHDEMPNPAYAGPSGEEPATIRGEIVALVVTVPRAAEELVHFSIVNGSIRVALLSPNIQPPDENGEIIPTLGMSWDDMVALFRLDREAALEQGQPDPLFGPGAAAVKATQDALAATQSALAQELTPTPLPISDSPTATGVDAAAEAPAPTMTTSAPLSAGPTPAG